MNTSDHSRYGGHRQSADPWWDYAAGAAAALRAGQEPPAVAVHGPFLEPHETARLSSPATYSRLLSGDGDYDRASAPFMVNPLLMGAAMAGQGMVNSRRRRAADREAQPHWTNHRHAAVLTTTQRLMCSRPQGGWVSFWYTEIAEFHPDPHNRTVTLAFAEDHTPPLQLSGPAAPAISLWIGHSVYGDRWHEDPRLAALIPTRHRIDAEQAHTTEHPDADQTSTHSGPIPPGMTAEQYAWWQHHIEQRRHRSADRSTDAGMEL